MANRSPRFNPAYSTISSIILYSSSATGQPIDITKQNIECLFERIEMVEDVTDLLPKGVILVQDKLDIVSRLLQYKIDRIKIEFFNKNFWIFEITGVSYLNNAASDTEQNFVGIYFTNLYYTHIQKKSLVKNLNLKHPEVFKVNDFVKEVIKKDLQTAMNDVTYAVGSGFNTSNFGITGYNDSASNYILYKPLNTISTREQVTSDNSLQYLNYVSEYSVGDKQKTNESISNVGLPNFMLWTEFDGSVNFKYFYRVPSNDPSFSTIDRDFRNLAIYDGDDVIRRFNDRKDYRKCYAYVTNPSFQFLSKNFYYIRKTPKFLDSVPSNLPMDGVSYGNYTTTALTFQFQDEGQKYNIEIVGSSGATYAIEQADQLIYDKKCGFYDSLNTVNEENFINHLSNNPGIEKNIANLTFMGLTGIMPFIDSTDIWKNMFDMTEIHPHYPNHLENNNISIGGTASNLSKVMKIRYDAFKHTIGNEESRLEKIRKIELQNFVMYSLCCMGKEEDSFFAALLKYEIDNKATQTLNDAKKYRYQWSKIKFNSPYGASGPTGASGYSGSTYYFHELEKWELDASLQSGLTQDDSWAINLNERGLSGTYLPPGWHPTLYGGFRYRPIGAKATFGNSGDIYHIVKMHRIPLEQLLVESGNTVYANYEGQYLNYFWAENVVDGDCQ